MGTQWEAFAQRTRNRPVRQLAIMGSRLAERRGAALDLGTCHFHEVVFFLQEGFKRVVAVNNERLEERMPVDAGFTFVQKAFEDYEFPVNEFDLIHAGFSLPFVAPDDFDRVFTGMRASLASGGIFCGQLFGPKDSWNVGRTMSFHSKAHVVQLLSGMDILEIDEQDAPGHDSAGNPKHWHVFHVIARHG
jgi:tellurite methyltransferase